MLERYVKQSGLLQLLLTLHLRLSRTPHHKRRPRHRLYITTMIDDRRRKGRNTRFNRMKQGGVSGVQGRFILLIYISSIRSASPIPPKRKRWTNVPTRPGSSITTSCIIFHLTTHTHDRYSFPLFAHGHAICQGRTIYQPSSTPICISRRSHSGIVSSSFRILSSAPSLGATLGSQSLQFLSTHLA